DLAAEQGDVAAGCDRGYGAAVDEAAAAITAEVQRVAADIVVVHVERGGHQATDVDLRAFAEQNAIGIDQEHLAVGVEPAHDHAAVAPVDAVDRDRRGVGLKEADRAVGADVEPIPVQPQYPAALVDAGVVADLLDAASTGPDPAA